MEVKVGNTARKLYGGAWRFRATDRVTTSRLFGRVEKGKLCMTRIRQLRAATPPHVADPFAWMDGLEIESNLPNWKSLLLTAQYEISDEDEELGRQLKACVVYHHNERGVLVAYRVATHSVGDSRRDRRQFSICVEQIKVVSLPKGTVLQNGELLLAAPMPHEAGAKRRIAGPFGNLYL